MMIFPEDKLPDTTHYMHEMDDDLAGGCAIDGTSGFTWKTVKTTDLFANKKVVIFGLPGAFTPTCTNSQLPGFDVLYEEFKALGVDEIWCTSVNDAFVMDKWKVELDVHNVKMLPDGNGDFARAAGMLVNKENLGFGERSWRYALYADNMVVKEIFEEPGYMSLSPDDPYGVSSPENVLQHLKNMV